MNIRLPLSSMLIAACLSTSARAAEALDAETTRKLQALGSEAFAIAWKSRVRGVSERGVAAVSDGQTTLTAREKFLTYIVHNRAATQGKDTVGFAGDEGRLREAGLRALRVSGAERGEIGDVRILQQYTQQGERGKAARIDPPQKSRRTLLVTRKVDDIPVISSRLALNLDRSGKIAFMELAWPPIPAAIREEAKGLRTALARDFSPPAVDGATIESREVVILHSPGMSFHEDVRAAIRVVYKPERPDIGKKPVRYVDAMGRDVELPRATDELKEPAVTRKG